MVELRRAEGGDVDWLVELYGGEDVEPFLGSNTAVDVDAVRLEVERSQREPARFGRLLVLADGERAGALGYHEVSAQHRIVQAEAFAIHPAFRRRGIGDEAARLLQRYLVRELGFHRVELAVYGFNERALAHAERVGYVREGVKRKAYLRHGDWQDAVLFSLLEDELEP